MSGEGVDRALFDMIVSERDKVWEECEALRRRIDELETFLRSVSRETFLRSVSRETLAILPAEVCE